MLANEKNVASLQSGFDAKLRELINQMNQNFAKVSSSGPSASAVPKFSTDYPQNGFVHKVEKGETTVSPKSTNPRSNGSSMPIRSLTPPRYLLGRNCLSPGIMTKGKSRLGRGLGGLLSQGGNTGVPVEASGLSGNTEISKPSLSIPS